MCHLLCGPRYKIRQVFKPGKTPYCAPTPIDIDEIIEGYLINNKSKRISRREFYEITGSQSHSDEDTCEYVYELQEPGYRERMKTEEAAFEQRMRKENMRSVRPYDPGF